MGTPAYMAPEQRAGGEVGPSSDQFTFCVVMFEALHGQRPFAGDASEEIAASMVRGEIRLVAGDAVPGWLDRASARGLSVKPDDRWPSMRALLDALRHYPVRRRRVLGAAGIASAAILASVGYGELSAWQARRETERGLVCKGAELELAGTWDPDRKRAL